MFGYARRNDESCFVWLARKRLLSARQMGVGWWGWVGGRWRVVVGKAKMMMKSTCRCFSHDLTSKQEARVRVESEGPSFPPSFIRDGVLRSTFSGAVATRAAVRRRRQHLEQEWQERHHQLLLLRL